MLEMKLYKIRRLKDGRFSFRYTCPKTHKLKTMRGNNKGILTERRNEMQKLQGSTPNSPVVSLTPFGTILDRYIADRKNDVANGHLREATLDGYIYHIDRLRPFRLEPITEKRGVYLFRYHNHTANKTRTFKSCSSIEAERVHRRIEEKHLKQDALRDEKIAALNKPIAELEWQFIKRLLASFPGSQKTKMHHFVTYTNIVHWAIKHNYLQGWQSGLIADARPAKPGKTQIKIPTEESVKKLIENSDDFWKPFWMIAATTGARLSELRALEWRNVHLNEGRIYIEQAAQRNGKIGPPKTMAAFRELPIGSEIVRLLSNLPRSADLVWPCPEFSKAYWQYNQYGKTAYMRERRLREPDEMKPVSTEDVYRLGMKRVINENDIEWEGRIHSLRHFAASRMIDKNWNIKRIQTRLGHQSAKTTLDVYGHLIERQSFHDEGESLTEGLV